MFQFGVSDTPFCTRLATVAEPRNTTLTFFQGANNPFRGRTRRLGSLDVGMRRPATPDQAIAALAGAQGGVVARAQLVTVGLSPQAISRRIAWGRLHRVHRGVYAVGHQALSSTGRRWAAVLACGDGAVLSHRTAADAWDLARSSTPKIDVTVPTRQRIRLPGLVVHRPRTLLPEETTTHEGLPITSAARTVLDLAAVGFRGRALEAALDRGELQGVLDFASLHRLLELRPLRAGSRPLRALLAGYAPGTVVTRSELEERFLALCDRFGFPRPRVNSLVEGIEVDFVWPAAGVVVEVDGYAWHRSPGALGRDRERDVRLVIAGYRVLRFTWEHVTRRPQYVATSLHHALGVTGPSRSDAQ
jgi:very-short-patch-repair endonuclease